MIIVFEGLSCVGKTSLINYLACLTECNVVEEWANCLNAMSEDIEQKCFLNDLYKTEALRKSGTLTLVDRYYPSTLACRFSESVVQVNEFISHTFVDNYIEPTWWVYIKEDVEQSIARTNLHRHDDNSPWFNVDQAYRIVQFYDTFFQYKRNVIRLNSSSLHSFLFGDDL